MPPKDAEVEVVEQEPLSVLRCVLFSSLNLCKRVATYFLEYAKDGRMKKGIKAYSRVLAFDLAPITLRSKMTPVNAAEAKGKRVLILPGHFLKLVNPQVEHDIIFSG